jgi:chloramphenicol 3-O-phosphotransferase
MRADRGALLVLDGPLMVGRTTTLHALQQAWPKVRDGPLLEVGLDRMLESFGPSRRRWQELVLPTSGSGHAHFGPLGREMVGGLHRSAASWARAGTDVAIDHALLDRATAGDLAVACEGLPLIVVGLRCDLDVLEVRAEEAGIAPAVVRAQAEAARGVVEHDLVLDTTEATTAELVTQVLLHVEFRLLG